MIEIESIDQLGSLIRNALTHDAHTTIGIDGKDGCGKTWLAQGIGKKLDIPVIELDEYLERNKGSFTEYIHYQKLRDDFSRIGVPLIVEGVCLLDVIKQIPMEVSILVYVKKLDPSGRWEDKNRCDPELPVDQLLSERRRELRDFERVAPLIEGSPYEPQDSSQNCPDFTEEIVHYHEQTKPYLRAHYIYLNYASGKLPPQ